MNKYQITIGLALLTWTMGLQAQSKIAKDLASMPDGTAGSFIVQYTAKPSSTDLKAITNAGGKIKRNLGAVNGAVASMTAKGARSLASNSRVKYISPDRSLRGRDIYTNEAVNATQAQSYGWSGANIGVAVIDSGVSAAADFGTRVVYSETFVGGTDDPYGHGTHVAGIIAGDSTTYKGVAPQAKIVSFRVLNDQGAGYDSDVIAAIDRAIALKSTHNIRVINLSLGRGVFESYKLDPLCQAAERAWQAGIVVVAAAGNLGRHESTNGYATIGAPGNDPFVITVDRKSVV